MNDDLLCNLQKLLDWHQRCLNFTRGSNLSEIHETAVPALTEAIARIQEIGTGIGTGIGVSGGVCAVKGREGIPGLWLCGACGGHVTVADKYCPACGRRVKWNV